MILPLAAPTVALHALPSVHTRLQSLSEEEHQHPTRTVDEGQTAAGPSSTPRKWPKTLNPNPHSPNKKRKTIELAIRSYATVLANSPGVSPSEHRRGASVSDQYLPLLDTSCQPSVSKTAVPNDQSRLILLIVYQTTNEDQIKGNDEKTRRMEGFFWYYKKKECPWCHGMARCKSPVTSQASTAAGGNSVAQIA